MSEMRSRLFSFKNSVYRPFAKSKQDYKKNRSTRRLQLNVYGDFNDLPGRTVSGKSLRDKAFEIVSNPNYDGYQHILASIDGRFIRTLKTKVYKHITAVSKIVYINKLDRIVEKTGKPFIEQSK